VPGLTNEIEKIDFKNRKYIKFLTTEFSNLLILCYPRLTIGFPQTISGNLVQPFSPL